MTTTVTAPWRLFTVRVARLQQLSPSFLRATFTGVDLDRFADNGFDQRIKLVLPLPEHGLAHLPQGPDWFTAWRALPAELRNPIRTYTVRAVRPERHEVDVDLVRHGDGGPASRWANSARPGQELGLIGPDRGYLGVHGGVEFRPPERAGALLLAGDETAVPAISAILEWLPPAAAGEALLEVPLPEDRLAVTVPAGIRVSWLPRAGGAHGSRLLPAVTEAAGRLLTPTSAPEPQPEPADIDVDTQLLWEVPAGAPPAHDAYAWLAGEAGVIRSLRRLLVAECGMPRESVAFMGYWRLGRPEV